MSGAITFLREFLAAPRSVGAVWPSSPALAEAMLQPVDFAHTRALVEFGPGTGAFTRAILPRLAPGARYLGIELNHAFCVALAEAFPGIDVVEASVTRLETLLAERDIAQVDAIISGLPWASLPVSLQEEVFPMIARVLAPGGVFVTFAYLHGLWLPGARALRARLRATFGEVARSPVVWSNVPPALCLICRRTEETPPSAA